MAFSFRNKTHKELVLIFNITSGGVEGMLISIENKAPNILLTKREEILQRRNTGEEYLTKVMLSALRKVTQSLITEGTILAKEKLHEKFAIEAAHYCISSPWVISQSKTVETNYPTPTLISSKEISSILAREKKNVESVYREQHPGLPLDLIFFEQKVTDTSCNGYPVNNPNGISATKLEVSFIMSMASEGFLKRIKATVGHVLHPKKEYFHSTLPLQCAALRSTHIVPSEYLFISIHGELTDIVIVRHNVCASISSFPFGSNTFLRKLSHSLNTTPDLAHSTLRMYQDKKLDEAERKKVSIHIKKLQAGWNSMRKKTIEIIGKETAVPQTAFVLSAENDQELVSSIEEGSITPITTPGLNLLAVTINSLSFEHHLN